MEAMQANDRNATLAIGSVRTQDQAERLIGILKRAGFSDQDLSVILPDDKLIQDPKIALDHKPGEDPADEKPRDRSDKLKTVTVGAVSGGIVLGAIGGLVGLASLAIPGLGLIVVAGPIAATLIDAAAGGAAGVIAGGLMGMRIPEHRAKQYEQRVREGSTLISIHTQNAQAFQRAMNILAAGGAEDLHEVVETSADPHSPLNGSQNSRVRDSLHPLGPKIGPTVQSTTAEKTARKNRHQELPAEQMEEAEQDAADPTHEKQIPPKP